MTEIAAHPIIEDFEFQALVPDWVEVRNTGDGIDFVAPCEDLYVWMDRKLLDKPNVIAALNNLAGAVFNRRHPSEILRMIQDQAKYLISTSGRVSKYPEADKALWDEYNALHEAFAGK